MYRFEKSYKFRNILHIPTITDYNELLEYAEMLEKHNIAEIESVKGHYEKCKKRIEGLEKELLDRTNAFTDTLKDKDKIIEHLKECNNELQSENIILRQELEVKEDILSKCNDDIRKIINEIGLYNYIKIIHK